MSQCINIKSCIEFGANIGMNLKALKLLYPSIQLNGIEINKDASQDLEKLIGKIVILYNLVLLTTLNIMLTTSSNRKENCFLIL